MKKIIALLLLVTVLLSAVSFFTSCKEELIEEPKEENAVITVADLKKYAIVRCNNASESLQQASSDFYLAMRNRFDVKFSFSDDMGNGEIDPADDESFEILIGNCCRTACSSFYADIRAKDYGYAIVGNKLVIGGGSDEATVAALSRFTEMFLTETTSVEESTVFFDNAQHKYLYRGNYALNSLTVNEVSISEYQIVYPKTGSLYEKELAERLSKSISEICGFVLPVNSDMKGTCTGKEIHVGVTSRDKSFAQTITLGTEQYWIGKNSEECILLFAESAAGIDAAVDAFVASLTPQNGASDTLAVTVTEGLTSSFERGTLSIMSFNIHGSENIEAVIELIQNYRPDTFGLQEDMLYCIQMLMVSLGEEYSYVGQGRDGGTSGEYCSIFYNKTKLRLLESGTKWLSDTPDIPSKYATSTMNRILTYALLERKSNGERFVHINTHLEHSNALAREEQVAVLMSIAETFSQYPILMTGDYNSNPTAKPYAVITGAGFSDSAKSAYRTENVGKTFISENDPSVVETIDFCFVRNVSYVERYRVVTDKINGAYPSDHFPVYVEYELFG